MFYPRLSVFICGRCAFLPSRQYHETWMNVPVQVAIATIAVLLSVAGLAQTAPDKPAASIRIPAIPQAAGTQPEPIRTLATERIVIEPQELINGPWISTATEETGTSHKLAPQAPWSPPSLDNRAVWESWPMVESFRTL
jgi:hypothetical protein